MHRTRWVALLAALALCGSAPSAAPAGGAGRPAHAPAAYEIGSPALSEIYVSPAGDDGAAGDSPAAPLRTLSAAWGRIPAATGATGYRINLLPGSYPCEPGEPDACINYFSDRSGSYAAPIIIRALGGPGSATIRGGMSLGQLRYLYLIDLDMVGGGSLPTNSAGNNLLHIDASDHILLRGLRVRGPACPSDACNNLQEVLKVNQVDYLYVEGSEFGGAWHSTVDYFAVHHGHVLGSRLHTAGQWCMYVKGGSAYLQIAGNQIDHCQLGFQAGQSANLAMMTAPWLHYEAYDIKVFNNVLHDLPGVGLSVAGGYDILFAHNTLYRVATDQDNGYGLIQAVHGERNCTPTDDLQEPAARCAELTGLGGWGPSAESVSLPAIPNRNVFVYNNLAYNPAPAQTRYSHLTIAGPLTPPAGFVNIPSPAAADDGLLFAGNLIWNGPPDHPLGVDAACLPGNPTCNEAQIRADNSINAAEPLLASPPCWDYRPAAAGQGYPPALAIPSFPAWQAFTPAVPAGQLANAVTHDILGVARVAGGPPGAHADLAAAYGCAQLYLPAILP